ncbi:hypothetical protein, partial [Yoonia sp. 208BN28-4]|uniref:hypothetical protein n=1 Tax=Yoonia sp. 208BN28-4 TaxID=3126505 RepID=UPI0030B53EB4
CIYDSFIIQYDGAGALKQVMAEASQAVVGLPINVESNFIGLDEIEQKDPDYVDGYKAARHLEPCTEYHARQHLFTERRLYLRSLR